MPPFEGCLVVVGDNDSRALDYQYILLCKNCKELRCEDQGYIVLRCLPRINRNVRSFSFCLNQDFQD